MLNIEDKIFDAIIVGSGPAGVSAAWPLVKSGNNILMLDVGYRPLNDSQLNNKNDNISTKKKIRAPEFSYVFNNFKERYKLQTENFSANGSLAKGGLSNAWSALVSTFTNEEFDKFPFNRNDLMPHYSSVAKRIGISGTMTGDLIQWLGDEYLKQPNLPIHSLVAKLLQKYEKYKLKIQSYGIKLGCHDQAILSMPHNNRPAFSQDAMNGYQDTSGAVYNSANEISELENYPNFKYLSNFFVENAVQETSKCKIITTHIKKNSSQNFYSKLFIIAAGTIGSTKLALKINQYFNKPLSLQNTPMFPLALLFPREVGRKPINKAFTYWHISYYLQLESLPSKHKIYGHFAPTDGINLNELSRRIPLPAPLDSWISKFLWPKMLLGTCIFPGCFSNNKLQLKSNNVLHISGNTTDDYEHYVKQSKKILFKVFRKFGAIPLTTLTSVTPGEDSHYASTIPMKAKPNIMETDVNGILNGHGNIYVVDGSVLSELPAKSHTFTIMANAERIGKHIVNRLNNLNH
jgi:choline dehydrogenase-like flavoprotein